MEVKERVRFNGAEVELQNMSLTLPPLNFKAMREDGALKMLNTVIKGMKRIEDTQEIELTDEELDAAVNVIYLAALRNYPDITKEKIAEGLDMDVLAQAIPKLITKNPTKAVKEVKND